jgi:hypothetical protein
MFLVRSLVFYPEERDIRYFQNFETYLPNYVGGHIQLDGKCEFIEIPTYSPFGVLSQHILASPPLDTCAFEKMFTAVANKPSVSLARLDQAVAPFILGSTSLSYAPQSQSSTGTPSHLPISFVFWF